MKKQPWKRGRMGDDKELLKLILKLRYGTEENSKRCNPLLTYAAISKFIRISATTVRYLCLKAKSDS
jgi:hypothetical protein